jgi:leader peptidase (prepilin peptidase) / N-methyltransferase
VTVVVYVMCGVFGLLIGSFLNVVIWRVPRGESIVRPPSHCPGCDRPIAPHDNIPVLSWLLLQGRCRHCGVRISIRYPAVELATAGLFVGVAVRIGLHPALPAFLYLAAVAIALALIDLEHFRLPDPLTLPSYPVGVALLLIAALADSTWWPFERALISMAALFALYDVIAFIAPKGMGGGDVKLAGVLGLYLGWLGWDQLAVGAFMAFLVGGIVSVGLVLFAGAGRKTRVPFGPFMLVGAFIGIFAGHSIGHGYTSLLGN